MTAAVTNDLTIIYNGLTIGGTTDYLIVGPWKLDWGVSNSRAFRRARVECTILVTGTPYATFVANRQALEAAFSVARARLQVTLGATTHIDLNPATNAGFNHTPLLRDRGTDFDTGSSRAYDFSIEVDLPSNLSNALADFAVEVSQTPAGRRKAVFTGTYTASGGTAAMAQYRSKIDAQARTFLDGLPASPITGNTGNAAFAVLEDNPKTDYNDAICTFRRSYVEVINNESVGTLNDPEIVQQLMQIERKDPAPGDSLARSIPGSTLPPITDTARRATELLITYDAWVTNTNALQARWTSKIRPLIFQVLAAYAAGIVAVLEEDPRFFPDDNRVSATIRAVAYNSKLVSLDISVDEDQDFGVAIDETWGDPYEADVSQGPARYTRAITRTSTTVGPVGLLDELGLLNPPAPPAEGWISLGRKRRNRQRKQGTASSGKQTLLTDAVDVELLRYVKKPSTGANPNRTATFSGLGVNPLPGQTPTTTTSSSSPATGAPNPNVAPSLSGG